MPKKLTQAEFVARAVAVHGVGRYDYSQAVYVADPQKMAIICPKHGVFKQTAFIHTAGGGCPKCAATNRQTSKRHAAAAEFVAKAVAVHGGRYDYSQVVYISTKIKVKISCPQHGVFEQTPTAHLSYGYGCARCGWAKTAKGRALTTSVFIERAVAVHGVGRYDYSQAMYSNGRAKVKIICPLHGRYEQGAERHLLGSGCDVCAAEARRQSALLEWVEQAKGRISTLYLIKLFFEGEEFYKIGVTHHSVAYRYRSKSSLGGYCYEALAVHRSASAKAVAEWEISILQTFAHLRYCPLRPFGGASECFSSADEILAIFPL